MEGKPIRILIVEDEFITIETLTSVLKEMNYSISGDAMTAEEAITILDKGETDLAILDINIKGEKSGIWIAEQIRDKYHIPFIFLTAFGDQKTVNRAIEAEPYGYLVKPFNKVDVFTAIEVALKNFAKQGVTEDEKETEHAPMIFKDSIYIRDDYMFVKLNIAEIQYIKSDKNYLEIYLSNKRHLVRGKLSDFAVRLPKDDFMQVHRSYIINLSMIDSFGAGHICINNVEVPLGKAYKDELKTRIQMF